ncbi:MAG: acyltransferase family protein [Ilumatobacteraceae bacterium]
MSNSFRYRPELDGIRALAVIAVIVYHLNSQWLPGGYLGVDVFFVMSGYLITSLLLLERRNSGRVGLAAFWSRRVRRLLPAMVVMVVAVAVYYAAFMSDLERVGLRGDLIATLVYVSNWRFISSGQSYFEQYVSASPVRHTWSLAIEEQFYLVWPIVVAVALRWRRSSATVGIIATAGIVVSVSAMAMLYDADDPSRAYFGSGARVHQMLVGVVLAVLLSRRGAEKVRSASRQLAFPAAVVLIVAACLLGDESALYYRGGSFAIAVAAAVLIAGLEGGNVLRGPLSWPPLVVVGTVSYGLYLWHWPVITVIGAQFGDVSSLRWASVAVAFTGAITFVSYRWIERPIRQRSTWAGRPVVPRLVLLSVPIVTLAAAGVVVATSDTEAQPEWARDTAQPGVLIAAEPSSSAADERPVVAVVGDSVMVSLLPGLRDAALDDDFELIEAAVAACPVGYEPLYDDAGVLSPYYEDRCATVVEAAHEQVVAVEPDVVIWHDLQSVLSRRDDAGTLLLPGSEPWADDLIAEWTHVLDRFESTGASVVLVRPPLRSVDPAGDCSVAVVANRCAVIQAQDETIRDATAQFWEHIDDRAGVITIGVDDLLCPDGYPCPSVIDGVQVRIDGSDQTHFTEDGARWFAPQLLARALVGR